MTIHKSSPTFGLSLPMVGKATSSGQLFEEPVEEVQAAEKVEFDPALVLEHHDASPRIVDRFPNGERLAVGIFEPDPRGAGSADLAAGLHSAPRRTGSDPSARLEWATHPRYRCRLPRGRFCSLRCRSNLARGALGRGSHLCLRAAWGYRGDRSQVRPVLDTVEAPPSWLGAWSISGLERAVTLADGWIADPTHTTAEVATMAREYMSRAGDAGRIAHVVVMRELWIDESDDTARAVYASLVKPVFRYYLKSGATSGTGLGPNELMIDRALADRVMCGSSATITDKIRDLHANVGAATYVFSLRHSGGPSHGQVLEAVERFEHKVLPAFRASDAHSGPTVGSQRESS